MLMEVTVRTDLLGAAGKRLLDAVYRINATTSLESFACVSLRALKLFVPYDAGSLFTFEDADESIPRIKEAFSTTRKDGDRFQEFLAGGYAESITFEAMATNLTTNAFRDSDLFSEHELLETPVYREIYLPAGYRYVLRIGLMHDSAVLGQYAFLNSPQRGEFTDEAVDICNVLSDHLALKLHSLRASAATDRTDARPDADTPGRALLSQRERQVAQLVIDGLSDKEAADRLGISISTVRKHISKLYSKTDTGSRAAFLKYAYTHHLVD